MMTINEAMAIILEFGAEVLVLHSYQDNIGGSDPVIRIKYKGQTIELEGRDCFQQAAHYIQKQEED